MKGRSVFAVACLFALLALETACYAGPYAPAATLPGSTAVSQTDPTIAGWATGYADYVIGNDLDASWQTPDKALGPAVGDSFDIVGLGRGGRITLTFAKPITDGAGFDFAVFENGFSDTFLELAYVEVSSNGSDFFRFANDSLTPGPVGAFGTLDPTDISGLGGKYRQGFGTPFDLALLAGVSPLLDVTSVGYVRILDVVGDGTYLDTSGDAIYDLYPTTGSAGFDLEAIAALYAVPEPGSFALAAWAGLAALVAGSWRRGLSCFRNPRSRASQSATFKEHALMKPNSKQWIVAGALSAAVVCAASGRAAADTVDFDDLSLAANAFWNGPDPAGTDEPDPFGQPLPVKVGSFISRGVAFGNRYNLNFGSWSGFAYSNTTDNTTPGFLNQYSAIPGSGHGAGEDIYGVAFGYDGDLDPEDPEQLDLLPHFTLPAGASLQSAYLTNTTYAALSMRDGDGFSKKFGGPDGTDPDWFKLSAYGADGSGTLLPVVLEFYLADYRFADSQDDTIVDTWTLWDLSPLAGAQTVYFNLASSDIGEFGMNTPSFFAIDDVEFTMAPEPSSRLLLLLGAALLPLARRRRR